MSRRLLESEVSREIQIDVGAPTLFTTPTRNENPAPTSNANPTPTSNTNPTPTSNAAFDEFFRVNADSKRERAKSMTTLTDRVLVWHPSMAEKNKTESEVLRKNADLDMLLKKIGCMQKLVDKTSGTQNEQKYQQVLDSLLEKLK